MPSVPWIFICPSSRGIGFHLTRHLLQQTTLPILATTRSRDLGSAKRAILKGVPMSFTSPDANDYSSPEIRAPEDLSHHGDRLHTEYLDVLEERSIESVAERANELFPPRTHHLHFSYAGTGVLTPEKSLSKLESHESHVMFRVNCLGPLLLGKYFYDFLPRKTTDIDAATLRRPEGGEGNVLPDHATWLFMSARLGSVTDNRSGGWFSYRASKAAVNSLAKSVDLALRTRSGGKALSMAYHPGTVRTEFTREFWDSMVGKTGGEGCLEVEDAVVKMLGVVRGLNVSMDRGKCWDWKGKEIPP
ncbi:hypothetical protein E4U43_005678 [Claviceps pusilla]|uniref:Uncharacterized protein n=1 Tax=Claviceps pusilla TaxID=123648 RepID=A0A9P7NEB6_9HYPO|nr:hypothetical protein E4U43_005678 [Claviceps pusilla]